MVPTKARLHQAVVLLGVLTACNEQALTPLDAAAPLGDLPHATVDAAMLGSADAARDLLVDAAVDADTDASHDAAPMHDVDADANGGEEIALPFDCPSDHFGLQRVPVGNVSLRVACVGKSGPVVLMLHGYPEYHMAWSALAPPLAAAGYRVIAPDQRGYAASDKPDAVAAYDIDLLVEDIHALLVKSKQHSVLLVGHDWGGVVAWVFTHRYPALVRGLVVMNAPHPDIWGHAEVDPVQAQASDGYIPLIGGPLGGLAMPVIDSMLSPHLTADELMQYRNEWNKPGAFAAMNKWYQANVYPSYTLPSAITITVPTLALWGADDTFVTPSELEHLPDYVANLEVVQFPGVDHWITHQITDDLLARITSFEQRLQQ